MTSILCEFLELKGWSEGMIEMFGLLNNQEAMMNSSFLELFREDGGNYYTNMCQIAGGADNLPCAFLPALGSRIRYGARMIAIDQTPMRWFTTRRGLLLERAATMRSYGSIPGPAACRGDQAVLARKATRHPAVTLRCFCKNILSNPAALLGGG
jgi:hypothetical protein